MRTTTIFIFLFFVSWLQAQTCSLKGQIFDKTNDEFLQGCIVKVLDFQEKTDVLETDSLGKFLFSNLECGSLKIEISMIGYKTIEKLIELKGETDLGVLNMEEDISMLKEVKIEGTTQRMEQRGDTTEYNANAYKVNPDATVEDLVKKMPGISVQNGQIQSQGETIQKVLIDGKEFFGEDAMMALRNLSADMVDKIQTLDRPSDRARLTGFDDGQNSRAMNIITKKGMGNSTTGRVYAGYGTDERYIMGGVLNKFSEKQKITLLGMLNNINQQNFSNSDLGTQERRGPQRPNQPLGEFATNNQNGIANTYAFGFNINQQLGKKINFSFSNFLNAKRLEAFTVLEREFFSRDSLSQLYNEKSTRENFNFNYRFNSRLEYAIDSNNALIWTPKLNYQNFANQNVIFSNSIRGNDTLNLVNNNNPSGGYSFSVGQTLLFLHKFKKIGRTISVSNDTEFSESLNDLLIQADKKVFVPELVVSITDQQQLGKNSNFNNNSAFTFTEKISEKSLLSANYYLGINNRMFERLNNSKGTILYDQLDSAQSATLNSFILRNGFSLGLARNNDKMKLETELKYENVLFRNSHMLPTTFQTTNVFHNILPMLKLNYSFTKNKRIRFRYGTSTDLPSANQLQTSIDNQNPVLLSTGNPNLKQQFTHTIFTRLFFMNPDKNRNLMIYNINNFTNNYVGSGNFLFRNDTTVFQTPVFAGSQLNQSNNLDGYRQTRNFIYYSVPAKLIKSNLTVGASFLGTRLPSLVNGNQNFTVTYVPGVNFTLSSNISEKIDFTISNNSAQTFVQNKLNPSRNTNFYTINNSLKANIFFTKSMYLNLDYNNSNFIGLGSGFDQTIHLMNLALGIKFLKDRKGDLKLSVFDAFNQNNFINRAVNDVFAENISTNLLQRYAMLTFTYNFKKIKPSKDSKQQPKPEEPTPHRKKKDE
ncbi:MAG: carboxypeptidase-like regulatory domain-containing protein [Cytophagales bacterium]